MVPPASAPGELVGDVMLIAGMLLLGLVTFVAMLAFVVACERL